MAFLGAQYTITATATNLTTILGVRTWCSEVKIRNATGAANALYVGGATVANTPANAYMQIAAGTTETFAGRPQDKISTDSVYLVGTANAANIAFITVIP